MKSTPTQLANLDRDHDGHPGGSLPKAKPAPAAPEEGVATDPLAAEAELAALRDNVSSAPQTVELDIPRSAEERARPKVILGLPVVAVNADGTRQVRGQNEFAAMVTRVNEDEGTVHLTMFLPNRGPELQVNIKHRDDAKPSDRFYWRHLQELSVDPEAKSGQP